MTGETLADEKTPQSPASPASPTNTDTDATLAGDGFVETAEDAHSTIQSSVRTDSIDIESAQPRT